MAGKLGKISLGKLAGGAGLLGGLAGKGLGKIAGKAGLKSLAKKIPVVGLLAGGAFAVERLMKGDYLGAGGEVLSGLASLIPGIGTAASLAIDAGMMARDMAAPAGEKKPGPLPDSAAKLAAAGKAALPAAGPVTLNYQPTINAGGMEESGLKKLLNTDKEGLTRFLNQWWADKAAAEQRRGFGGVGAC